VSALVQANSLAARDLDRRDVTRYVWSHPRLFLLGWTPLPLELDRDDVRLVIEGEEDWEHVQEIVEALGQDNLDWRTLAELLKYQPGLRGNMARLNRAEEATAAALAR
jgi:spore coat polysaccharide biosynthesis protein SpsF (cytidylyltransferase family)